MLPGKWQWKDKPVEAFELSKSDGVSPRILYKTASLQVFFYSNCGSVCGSRNSSMDQVKFVEDHP